MIGIGPARTLNPEDFAAVEGCEQNSYGAFADSEHFREFENAHVRVLGKHDKGLALPAQQRKSLFSVWHMRSMYLQWAYEKEK